MTETSAPRPLRKTGHNSPGVLAAREKRRAAAVELGLDEAFISELVDTFYTDVRADPMLGPIFARHVTDWPEHLDRLKQFWRSILHASGEFTGNPMVKHMMLGPLGEAHFARWLDLFYAALTRLGASDAARKEAGERARMIADSLLTGLATRELGLTGARAGANLPRP